MRAAAVLEALRLHGEAWPRPGGPQKSARASSLCSFVCFISPVQHAPFCAHSDTQVLHIAGQTASDASEALSEAWTFV